MTRIGATRSDSLLPPRPPRLHVSTPSVPALASSTASSLNQQLICSGSVITPHTTSGLASIRISRSTLSAATPAPPHVDVQPVVAYVQKQNSNQGLRVKLPW